MNSAGIKRQNVMIRMTGLLSAGICMIALFSGCRQESNKNTDSSGESTMAATESTKEYSLPKEQRVLCGTFLQYWYASGWSEARWKQEMQNMADNGMTYLIVPVAASRDKDSGVVYTYYPSKIQGVQSSDSLEVLFQYCEQFGIKVFIAPFADDKWYCNEFGWSDHSSVNDGYGVWMKKYTEISNQIASELYNLYAAKYPNAFYGWYYSDELWNMTPICKGKGESRNNTLDIIASGFNGVLDHYSKISPGKPFIFSPFSNRSKSTADEYKQMWVDLFARINFRDGDIFCPQDSIGGTPSEIKVLADWVRGYREAADTKPGLRFWMNNENFSGEAASTLDRFVKQITITSAYCEANVTFSWQHHYSPYHENTNKGYSDTYHDFYVNKKLDSQSPTAPKVTLEKNEDGKTVINFTGSTDNIGVCGFNIYRNKETNMVTSTRASQLTMPHVYIPGVPGKYFVEAFDFANNRSPKVEINVPDSADFEK